MKAIGSKLAPVAYLFTEIDDAIELTNCNCNISQESIKLSKGRETAGLQIIMGKGQGMGA